MAQLPMREIRFTGRPGATIIWLSIDLSWCFMCQPTDAVNYSAAAKACPDDCRSCSPGVADERTAEVLTGWRLGASAVGVFLLPLAAATAGAAVSSPERQLVGCLIGLAGGAAAAAVTARLLQRSARSVNDNSND